MIPLKLLYPSAKPPRQSSDSAAAYDLFFHSMTDFPAIIKPHDTVTLGTGVALALDIGCKWFTSPHGQGLETFPARHQCALLLPRSGLGCKGLRPGNTPGLIDPDYRGELLVCLHNDTDHIAAVQPGDRIAQLLIIPFLLPGFHILGQDEALPSTSRGANGSAL